MARQIQPKMDLGSFEALQRATVAHAAASGVNRPSMIDSEIIPANCMEIQRNYAKAVLSGQTDAPTFQPDISPEQGTVARNTLVSFLRAHWSKRK